MSDNPLIKHGVPIALGVIIAGVIIAADLPFGQSLGYTILALLAGSVMLFVGFFIVTRIRMRRLRRLIPGFKQIQAGEIAPLQATLEAKRTQGTDWTPEDAMLLCGVYNHQGHGEKAEPLAREARARLEQEGVHAYRTKLGRWLYDTALLSVADALSCQGRYDEAARLIRGRASQSLRPNWLAAITAWMFFLGRDEYNARVVLVHVGPHGHRFAPERWIDPKYRLMVEYMRYRLLNRDTRAEMAKLANQLPEWEDEYSRHTHNPYGPRLREILDDIRLTLNIERTPAP